MQPIVNYIKHPYSLIDALVHNFGQWLPDSTYIRLRYRCQMGKRLNLKHPKTFQEKLQWLKLHDHNPEYTKMVDKVLVKEYVASKVGSEYVIPLLGVWDKPEDIEWDLLPNRFVLKTNHSGGNTGVVICHDKSTFDRQLAISKLNASLRGDVYKNLREWPYKNVKKKVFAEEFVESKPDVSDLTDYKWYCFNGEPKYCQVIQNRTTKETIDFFDTDWNHQDFVGMNPAAAPAAVSPAKPSNLDIQIKIARELSKGTSFSRIDLYETEKNTFFGEVTFYPFSGYGVFTPNQYNEMLGKMLTLPGEQVGGGAIIRIKFKDDKINDKLETTVADQYELQVSHLDLPDYKFFCFDGEVKALFVAEDRQTPGEVLKFDFFDDDYNHLPVCQGHPNAPVLPAKPRSFEEMKKVAAKLSEGIPHVRVDFYEVNGRPFFGELTFCHFGAMVPFEPEEWDYKFGEWLDLNKVKRYDE